MFNTLQSQAYLRDGLVPFADAQLSIASSPILYGLSVYTTFSACRTEQGQLSIFRLSEHYKRLVNSARIMDFHSFATEWPWQRFEASMLELLRQNHVQEDVLVRVTVFIDELMAGTRIHGLRNSLSAYVYPFGQLYDKDLIDVCVSSWQRTADNAIPSRAKINGSYINAALMKNEALLNGYDDAIAIDENGHVSESSVANIFIVRDGCLLTPDGATDMLEGISRASLLQLAKDLAIPVMERSIDRSELYIADEAMLCGSSARLTPIASIDKRPVGNGTIGPLTQRLAEAYHGALTGSNAAYEAWRTLL